MRIDDAPDRLRELLRDAGSDPAAAWEAFGAFARETIDGLAPDADEDLLLFEAHRDADGTLTIDLERQYGPEGDMRSALCTFTYPAGSARGAQVWGRPGAGARKWIAEVEATEAFSCLSGPPSSVEVACGRI